MNNYEGYVGRGSDPKTLKLFKNVSHPCLVMGDPEKEVGELISLPELHLLMGVGI